MENDGPKKGKTTERTDEEVQEILRKAAQKPVVKDNSEPALSEEALNEVKKNIEKGGKVWEEEKKDDSAPE